MTAFFVLGSVVVGLVVVGVGYYMHRKGFDKAVLDAAKQDVQNQVDKLK